MKQELIYSILPVKAYEIELKCFYASHFILGRIFALWNKKKKAIKVNKDYFLKIKHLKKPAFWLILKELQDKNIITVTRINNNNNVMIINFTDYFIENYVNAPASNNVEDCEEITDVTDVTESIEEDEHIAEPLEDAELLEDDDYMPVEGWANTNKREYRKLLERYGGKVPELPAEVLNYDYGKHQSEDFDIFYIDENRRIYDMYSNGAPVFFHKGEQRHLTIDEVLAMREKNELSLEEYIDLYETVIDEYNHLTRNDKN